MNRNRGRKNLSQELRALRQRMAQLLEASMGERRRTRELLRETELRLEEKFGHMDSLETIREKSARRFRKEPNPTDASAEGNMQRQTLNAQRSTSNRAGHSSLEC